MIVKMHSKVYSKQIYWMRTKSICYCYIFEEVCIMLLYIFFFRTVGQRRGQNKAAFHNFPLIFFFSGGYNDIAQICKSPLYSW